MISGELKCAVPPVCGSHTHTHTHAHTHTPTHTANFSTLNECPTIKSELNFLFYFLWVTSGSIQDILIVELNPSLIQNIKVGRS